MYFIYTIFVQSAAILQPVCILPGLSKSSGPGLLPFMRFHITWFQDLGPSKQFEHFWFNSASCMWPEDAGKTTGSLTCDGLLLQSLCYQTFLGFVGFD